MTRISRIVMQGFKSFAKRTELNFGEKFNCILGPNGSGKSNVGDAICFVLGKTSSKSLRAEKSANLIYNGGKSKKQAKFAEVCLYFDNSSKTFPFDLPEVKISRMIRADGASIYRINDDRKTRQEVVELLNIASINPDGYNIILQGDIVRLVEMSSEERRKVIEEVAGISIYEEKKEKAMSELSKVEQKISEAEIILAERDNSLKDLKKDRNQALHYKKLESQIKTNKASYIKIQMDRRQGRLDEVNAKLAEEQKGFNEIDAKIKDHKAVVDKNKDDIAAINRELEQKGTKEQNELQKSISDLQVGIATSKQRIETADGELKKIAEREKQLKAEMAETERKLSGAESEKKESLKLIEEKKKQIAELDRRLKDFKEKFGFDEEPKLSKEIEDLEKDVEEKQKEIAGHRERQQELTRDKDRTDVQIEVIDEKINKVLEIEKDNKGQLDMLKQKRQEFKKATLDLSKCLNDDSSLSVQIKNARENLFHASEELNKLQARSSAITESVAGGQAIKEILEQKKTMSGIYGTVSELGKVSSKYSLALEIAAGERMKSIVVEDDAVASRCIKHLKQNKLGVAKFLPLNKIKARPVDAEMYSLAKASGAHGLAVDLVTFDDKFKKIFSYVFGGTVVVDDIETARKIGIGRAKMVTLDGDMAEETGAMTGGFREKRRSFSFIEKEVARDLEHYETEVADSQSLLSGLEGRKEKLEEQIIKLRQFKAELEGDIIKMEKSMHLESDDLDASKKLKKDLQDKTKELDKEIEKVNDLISECNSVLASNKSKREGLRFRITKLKNPQIMAEYSAFGDKHQELKEAQVGLEAALKGFDTQIETLFRPEIEKLGKITGQLKKDKEKAEAEREELKAKVKELDAQHKESVEKQKQFFKEFGEYYKRRDKLTVEINENQNAIDKLYEKLRGLDHKRGEISSEKVMLETELVALQREFAEYEGIELNLEKSEEKLKKEIADFDKMIADLGSINLKAIEVYDAVEKEYGELIAKKEKLIVEKQDVMLLMNEIEGKKKELFMKTFDVLYSNFKTIFATLNKKGEVQLVLEDPENPFNAGLQIRVKLSGTKFMDIRGLSGGEKTLTALAFIFAIQEYDPASFYILDEVDAALDKHNSEYLAELLRKYSDKAQYIVVSHNDSVIAHADLLFGASMNEHGMTSVVSLKLEDAPKVEAGQTPG